MSEQERIIKVKFDPEQSQFKDIFENDQARALWCLYKNTHIISGEGLDFLNTTCRDLIKTTKIPFDEENARKFLTIFCNNMGWIEYSKNNYKEWIETVIPFLLGQKKVKLVTVSE